MINHDQFRKALDRQKIVMSNLQINALLNDLLPNPQSGFGVSGVNVWGDERSIKTVRQWHHAATARLPYFEKEYRDNVAIQQAEAAARTNPGSGL